MSSHLIRILKNDPQSINSYLVNISKEELYKKYHHLVLKDGNLPMEIIQDKIKNYKLK